MSERSPFLGTFSLSHPSSSQRGVLHTGLQNHTTGLQNRRLENAKSSVNTCGHRSVPLWEEEEEEEEEDEEREEDLDEEEDSQAIVGVSNSIEPVRRAAQPLEDDERSLDSRVSSNRGYSSAMASNAIFHTFPEPGQQQEIQEPGNIYEDDRFVQKHYPMLYMNLRGNEHPSIVDVQYANEGASCPLCQLDRNTLDSIKVLKPHEVKGYLESYDHRFTEEQVNVHLAHTVGAENVIGVIQNMSVDLISKSYSLANWASLRIMNRVTTHMGRPLFVPDLNMAKVHNDAVKQFTGLASTCQALLKSNHVSDNKGVSVTTSSLL